MERGIYEIVDTESLVPAEHLLRKIDAAINWNKLYDMVAPLYCEDNGRPSIDPVVLFKMVLIQHLYGLPSLRRTAEEVSLNVAYRWFLGYRLQEETPHFSTIRSRSFWTPAFLCFFVYISHNIGNIAIENPAQFIHRMGGNIFSPLYGIVIGLWKAQLEQPVGSDSLFLHRLKQWLIADHNTAPIQTIFCMFGIAYLR